MHILPLGYLLLVTCLELVINYMQILQIILITVQYSVMLNTVTMICLVHIYTVSK